jgi:peptidyl-prolyl cis-trans isomerase SurA
MNAKHLILSAMFLCGLQVVAQKKQVAPAAQKKPTTQVAKNEDPQMLVIGGKPVSKSEFLSIYKKNNKEQKFDSASVKEYLELFINFKLKVREAEEMGLDTIASFKNELEGYRKQLAQPYLVDNEVNEQLLREAYDRMKTDIKAAHILIKCPQEALPKDTLAAYNKSIEARNKILKGEAFEEVAKKYSEDPSVKENNGDLGFFTSLQMVYPFESACYKSKAGDITMPVRTRFGYHIIKVIEKRPNPGQITAAHIMIKGGKELRGEDSVNVRKKIDEIYAKLKAGEDFAELAKQFSDDKASSRKGGELPSFGTGRMVLEFEKAAFALAKDGDYSAPVQTMYGWHIIKRLSKKEIGSFEELKNEIKTKVGKDSRSQKSKDSMLGKIKKEYGFSDNPKLAEECIAVLDTTFFEGKWKASSAKSLTKNLCKIGDKQYTQADFAKFLESHQTKRTKIDMRIVVTDMYKQFVDENLLAYEENNLGKKHADYRSLLQEYRDGILLFDLTDKKVWSKAVKDTVGLKEFYDSHKEKYMWDERVQATVYTCKNDSIANAVKALLNPPPAKKKKKDKDADKVLTESEILAKINQQSQLNLRIEHGKFSKGENEAVDKSGKNSGISPNMSIGKQSFFVNVEKILAPEPKTLSEAKGLITADYQNVLEKQWIETLRKKYKVEINRDVLSKLP